MSCAHGICGSDGLTINSQSALACQKLVKDYDYTKEILIEPLKYFVVVKDLIVDLKPFFERIKSINPQTPPSIVSSGKGKNSKHRGTQPIRRRPKMHPLRLLLRRLPSHDGTGPGIRRSSRNSKSATLHFRFQNHQ